MKDWCLEVWGDYACFTRPEMKVERVSYDIITPSAARAIYDSILWKPAIRWNILKIEVLKPIKWISVRRNEVGKTFSGPTAAMMKGEMSKPLGMFIEEERQQRAGLFLRDVRYRLHARFDFIPPSQRKSNFPAAEELWADAQEQNAYSKHDENEAKYAAMFARRAKKGQCYHRPYLGCREFACYFKLVNNEERESKPIEATRDLGWMLYDLDYSNSKNPLPMFYNARMENGIVRTDKNVVEVRG